MKHNTTLRYTALVAATGLLFHAMNCGATLPPYQPPTLQEKVKRAEVIAIATVGDVRYYKWPDASRSELPKISDVPIDGYSPYVNLVDIQILYDENAHLPANRNPLKTKMLLWTQQRYCFAEYGEPEPELFPKRQSFIFFLGRPVRSSQDTLMETGCDYKSESTSQLPAVKQLIRSTKQPNR